MPEKTPTKTSGLAAELGMQSPFRLPEREVFLNLARTFSVLNHDMDQFFKPYGITPVQYNALRILRGHGKPVSVYQIGEQMVTRQPDLPRLVDRLVAMELATKKRCQNDRRVMWVSLTPKGRALLKKIDKPLDRLHQDQLSHLAPEQLQQLSVLLCLARKPGTDP